MSNQRPLLWRIPNLRRMIRYILSVGLPLLGIAVALTFWQTPSQPREAVSWLRSTTRARLFANQRLNSQPDRTLPNARTEAMDTIADEVWGQPDLMSNDAALDDSSLDGAQGVFYDSFNDQIFVADTANHRVLGWSDLLSYQTGDPATLVLGQPDFESNTLVDPPTAASLNAPTAVFMDLTGALYVADTGNNRVLIYEPDEDGQFTSGMDATVVIGQPDFTSNDAMPPSASSLSGPTGIAVDRYQNLVVADTQNNRVLIFEPPHENGMEALWVIGQPTDERALHGDMESSAAPNPPSAVSLNRPTGVAIASIGDVLFVADSGNHRVLAYTKYPLDARADLVIGQPDFTSNTPNNGGLDHGSLNNPYGLHIDSGDRLFVADKGNHRVLLFPDPFNSATATVVFGQPNMTSANEVDPPNENSLNAPTHITSDDLFEDVYVADSGNNRIVRYDDPLPNPLPQVRQILPATIRAGSPATQIMIQGPGIIFSTTVSINGQKREPVDLFVGEITVNLNADELASTGVVSITLENPEPGGGVSPEAALVVYAPQAGDTRADAVQGQLGFHSREGDFNPVDATTLYYPHGMATSPVDGRVFVADFGNARVLSWPNQQALLDSRPADLVIGQKDFESFESGSDDELLTASELSGPVAVAVDGSGNLYVADAFDNRVLIYRAPLSSGMAASMVIGQPDFASYEPHEPSESSLNLPLGLAVNSAGDLFVADSYNHRVLRFDAPLASGDAEADGVYGQQGKFNTGALNLGGITAASLNFPIGVAVDDSGNLYVADSDNHRILIFSETPGANPQASIVLGQGGDFTTGSENKGGVSASSLSYPSAVAIRDDGSLAVTDSGNNRVLIFHNVTSGGDLAADLVYGQQNSFTSNEANLGGVNRDSLNFPWQPAFDTNGNLFVTDSDNHRFLVYFSPPTAPAGSKLFIPVTRR